MARFDPCQLVYPERGASFSQKSPAQNFTNHFFLGGGCPIEFNKYLLSACYTQDFVSDTWDTSEDKTTVRALMELTV